MGVVDGLIVSGGSARVTRGQASAYLAAQPERVLTDAESAEVVAACWDFGDLLGIDAGLAFAQMCHETNIWRFTGDVRASQRNPAGIGAIGGGAQGLEFASWRMGIAAYYVHLLAWCDRLNLAGHVTNDPSGIDPRLPLVAQARAVKGAATTWRSLGGRWAVRAGVPWEQQANMPGNYGTGIERHHAALLAMPRPQEGTMRVALAAGHRNTSGGNANEAVTTAILTPLIAAECRDRGLDVRVITPDEGRGVFPGSLTAVANRVVEFANQGWRPDIFLEVHTEGVDDPNVNGVFVIYPDDPTTNAAGRDLDGDVRDNLGPMLAKRIAARGDFRVRGNGVMSERNTGVGGNGDRLGVFAATSPLRATLTRMIIEFGSHSNPGDFALHRNPAWQRNVAVATAECLRAFLAQEALPPLGGPDPIVGLVEPNGGGPEDNPTFFATPGTAGFSVLGPFFDYYHREPRAMTYWGWPRSEEFLEDDPNSPYHGQIIQFFDRALFHRAPNDQRVEGVLLGLLGYYAAKARGLAA